MLVGDVGPGAWVARFVCIGSGGKWPVLMLRRVMELGEKCGLEGPGESHGGVRGVENGDVGDSF